jgi:hypothetical protein
MLHDSLITQVAWAKTCGRLASSEFGKVIISLPSESKSSSDSLVWKPAITICQEGTIKSMSWSFYGDILCSLGKELKLWHICTVSTTEITCQEKPLWTLDQKLYKASISPDGRLVATLRDNNVNVWHRVCQCANENEQAFDSDAFSSVKLKHNSRVIHMEWKDISMLRMYVEKYIPNAIITITESGSLRIWTEYYSPKGIGFNIAFQVVIENGIATWLKDFTHMENHSALLNCKQEYLKKKGIAKDFATLSHSCILRSCRSGPDETLYGALMRSRVPVDWFVIIQGTSVTFYYVEGLGTYPATAIHFKPQFTYDRYWSKEAIRWMPSKTPIYAIKEDEEVQIIAFDKTRDLVRWRKLFVILN